MKKLLFRFWPIVCIIALWAAFSFPFFARGLVPFPSDYLVTFFPPWNSEYGMPVKNNAIPDVISQIYPWKRLTVDTWKSGNIPLWNPYSFSGTRHAANYQSAVFSPVNLLFFVLPFADAWSVMILLQPLIAGAGMYIFLRRLTRSRTGAVIGSVGFMFCGFMTTWMAYGTLGYAIAFLPWALWAVTADFIRRSPLKRIFLSLTVALSFVSGHFQISLYMFAAVILYILFNTLRTKRYSEGIMLSVYSLLGLGIAAPQLALSFDAYRDSTRSASFTNTEVIPWRYFITGFAPDFFGNPVTRNDWFGHYAEWASYIGVVPFIMAIISLTGKIRGKKIYFLLLAAAAFLFAYPTPFNDLLFRLKLPAVSTSAASRIIVLWSFALSTLAAYGVDDVLKIWWVKKRRAVIIITLIISALVILIWGIILFVKPLPPDHLIIAKRNFLLPTVFTVCVLICMWVGFVRNTVIRRILLVLFVLLTMCDMYRFVTKWMPFEQKKFLYPQIQSLQFLKTKAGYDRVFGNIGNEVGGTFQIPLIEGYDAVYQGRYAQFINAASDGNPSPGARSVVQFNKQGKYKTEAFRLLGVRYIYHRLSDGRKIWAFPFWDYLDNNRMKQIYYDDKYEVFEYSEAYPRAFLASAYVVARGDEQIIRTLFSDDLDRRNTLVLEQKPGEEPKTGSGSAEIISYHPDRVTIRTRADAPKLLFLSDVFDPGWSATIDGTDTKIYRADFDFRAVSVPAGTHTVEFRYFPAIFGYGLILSLFAVMIMIIVSVFRFPI